MKKVILILCFLLIPLMAWADPHITIKPYSEMDGSLPDELIVELINVDTGEVVNDTVSYVEKMKKGRIRGIVFDLAGYANGNYTVSIMARNLAGSSEATIYTFFYPAAPLSPVDVLLE